MRKGLVVLGLLLAVTAWGAEDLSLPGIHQVTGTAPDGAVQVKTILVPGAGAAPRVLSINPGTAEKHATRSVREPAEVLATVPSLWPTSREVRGGAGILAATLWVDRAHQYAISNNMAISGNGQTVLAGWYLNNERTSCYRMSGAGTPLWVYKMPRNGLWSNYVSVGASGTGGVLSAVTSSDGPTYKWDGPSPMPAWMYNNGDPGALLAVSRDGSRIAVASSGLKLYVLNAATGDTVFTRPYNSTRGLYGVDLSTDGNVVMVSTYDSLEVWRSGTRVPNLPNYGQTICHLSGDGNTIVSGDFRATVYTYRWGGSSYNLLWSNNTGHPWVTSVDISADGNWVVAGTFQYSPSNMGKVLFYNIGSSTPSWQYNNYLDFVASVAVSDTGGYAIAGSWGDINASIGDVISIFGRADSIPILAVPSSSEPGSSFAVDIAGDGSYATAGGKAVHARISGNGGYVYGFQIRTSATHDVASASVDSPPELLQVGQSFTPQATYSNPGTSTESFPVALEIFDSLGTRIYNASGNVTSLAPGATQQVSFSPDWTVSSQGWFRVRTIAQLSTDQFRGNDTLAAISRAWHDVGVQAISAPFAEITINYGMNPIGKVVNLGTYTEDFSVYCSIRDSLSALVYADTVQVSGLAPYANRIVTFARAWAPSRTGTYTVRVYTSLSGDYRPQNDALQIPSVCTYEIIYDDGGWDAFYQVRYPHDNDKFYVQFTPTVSPPFDITRGRFPINVANTPFDYVMICPDNGGLPDTANPLQIVNNVQSPTGPGWAVFDLSIHRTDASDLWMVAHWPDNAPSFGIGADVNQPRDNRSYFSSNQNPFTPWTAHDWMMRLLQATAVGVEELTPSGIPLRFDLAQNTPNPWGVGTKISFALPHEAQVVLRVYNPTGQLVRTLVNGRESAGYKQAAWDGRDDLGHRVPSGVYFYRLQAGSFLEARKMVLVR
jgi:hypothetical protein